MTNRLIRRMLTAQILSNLAVSICLLIDNVIINRTLTMKAVAAYELAFPLLMGVGAVASILSAGIQVACSRSLGLGSREETDRAYSTAVAVVLLFSVPFTLLVFLLREPIALLLGAGSSPELLRQTTDYLSGFVIAVPATIGALCLLPFLQMAGKNGLLIAAVAAMTVVDVALDLVNAYVLRWEMLGMGLASSISYYAALAVALIYFLSKKSVFRFSRKLVTARKAAELLRGGAPSAFTLLSSVVMSFALNRLLMAFGGETAVAACAIVSGITNAANSVSAGMNGVTLTLSGILFSEEDRGGLHRLLRSLVNHAAAVGSAACMLCALLAPLLVRIFLSDPGPVHDMAVRGVRMTALGLAPCCLFNVVKSFYQGTGRIRQMEVLAVLEGAALPVLCAWLLGLALGTDFIWLYFVAADFLVLALVVLYGWLQERRDVNPVLDDSFGVPAEDAMERLVTSMEDVMKVSRGAEDFCTAHGGSTVFARRVALCIEEMAGNTVQHGFRAGGRPPHISVRVQHKGDRWVLRFRDDCRAFDPVHYVPGEGAEDGLGIRLVLGMADDARYTYSLSLNNLTIELKEGAHRA